VRRRARGPGAGAALLIALLALPATGPLPRPVPVAIDPRAEADLFAMPRIAEATRAAAALAEAGDLAAAARLLDGLAAGHPGLGGLRADRAALAMLAGDPETALVELEAAAGHGFDVVSLAADPLFAPLARDPRFRALAARPAPPPAAPAPAPVTGEAVVSGANTAWDPAAERLTPRFTFPETSAPVLPPGPKLAALDLLREHWRRGRAAGNWGDLYDNRDRGHSALDPAAHPQLARVVYAPAARAADVDYGLNDRIRFDRPVLGNSSTAITGGPLWRSLPRLALTRADGTGPLRLWQNASSNALYVHPAHKDYADTDLFPANTPYLIVSHGSSGSDQPFLEAVAMILAAFRPDTKARLAAEGLIVPTVQMVFRRSQQNVTSRASYFSGEAHPAAFEAYNINLARMVSLANSIEPGAIPPQVRIRVLEEDLGTEGVDFFGQGLSEQLFDTPAAVARIWRSKAGRRSMLVTAGDTRDPNGRPLTFEWHLLQGDPGRVKIEPLGDGRTARITLDWHDPFRISEDNPVVTSRVDIGVFVNNGVHDSAPAMLSWYFPPESRTYAPGPDGPRILAVDHTPKTYADPMLFPRAGWRDDYAYDAAGRLTGWTRHRQGRSEAFTAAGARILTRDPLRTEPVIHALRRSGDTLVIDELSPGAPLDYAVPAGAPPDAGGP
jgi:YD repeat-containing protein